MRYFAAWLIAAALAVTVGVVAVSGAETSIRGRGPLGENEYLRQSELDAPAPSVTGTPSAQRAIEGEYGRFVVGCQGGYAVGVRVVPASGWRVVSFERGPDDDVDAVFASGRRSVELEVFCNRGVPTLAELERKTLSED